MKASRAALATAGVVSGLGAALWARRHPSACPYSGRWLLEVPRPYLTIARLIRVLEPVPGERLLEVGPGTGHFSVPVAELLEPGGELEIFDIQQEMLDHVAKRAGRRGVRNLRPTQGDGRALPYEDGAFDGAFLITVLGEIPDQAAALRELGRVLKPGGRLVVGEIPPLDPHFVTHRSLRAKAAAAGLREERILGRPALGYLARFSK